MVSTVLDNTKIVKLYMANLFMAPHDDNKYYS